MNAEPGARVAVLGGDRREWRVAVRLAEAGHAVRGFGVPVPDEPGTTVDLAVSAADAVAGAHWIVCPTPGLSDGDVLYAPHSPAPVALDHTLLARSAGARGGLILGKATPGVAEAAAALRIPVVEVAGDAEVRRQLAVPAAEQIVSLLIEHTDRVLPELRVLVLGTGTIATAVTRLLLGLNCAPIVAARNRTTSLPLESAGASTVGWADRVAAIATSDVVVNTVPHPEAIGPDAYPACRDTTIIDVASPPGGMDHDRLRGASASVIWARGLAGRRAPLTAGDIQSAFVLRTMARCGAA